MSNTKFTKGDIQAHGGIVFNEDRTMIATFCVKGTGLSEDNYDAILFKTAPKLYEMLEDVLENEYLEHDRMIRLEEVLAEARGE